MSKNDWMILDKEGQINPQFKVAMRIWASAELKKSAHYETFPHEYWDLIYGCKTVTPKTVVGIPVKIKGKKIGFIVLANHTTHVGNETRSILVCVDFPGHLFRHTQQAIDWLKEQPSFDTVSFGEVEYYHA